MPFHRLTVPAYFGGLPGGYDYINNAVAGTPALVDPPKVGGPNAGTYFIAWGEPGISRAANRGLSALAQNTDQLDDWFHRDIAMPTSTADVFTAGGTGSVVLTGPGIFLGAVGTPNTADGIATFLELVDSQGREFVEPGMRTWCRITAISGGTVGSGGFSVGNVTLTISPAIPAGTTYRVHYAVRGNLSAMPVDAITALKIRASESVSALLQQYSGAAMLGYGGGPAWADATLNPPTTVELQFDKIVSDLVALTGAPKIGAAATAGTPYALVNGTVKSQIDALLTHLNAWYLEYNRVRALTTAGVLNNPQRDGTIILNPAGGSFGLQLPNPNTCSGQRVRLINGDGSMAPGPGGRSVNLQRFAGEKINNFASDYVLNAPAGQWTLTNDGVDWYVG